ncbi:protein of unknown function [Taphrina deformans PYCC 5710]|uniref:Uncharacterized protein n=1 Tax=Taphrina deformans (strain PYCC 5710 / ATCC 11124 / CBS 356.35 / IMI 108563 / JCM 9778 / NBRC 8474) TaxID=1097556 RepID=R4XEP3_TAPDE|nr:protein of unknown function [Taphrina deformans PYCC 5710]|eukprot:CCG84118.1 protein of unknown function [Taphrina deformans PYCC 5710]
MTARQASVRYLTFVGTASFVYHAGFNVISAKIENTAPNVQHVNLMAFCYGFGTNKPRGHANIRFTIPTQGKIDGLYKGLNYACRTEQGLQLSLYVYSMNEGDIDPCARNPLVPIG